MRKTRIKEDSFSAKLYMYFYDIDKLDEMPKGLCSFFWKLVIACIFVIPLEMIGIPYTLFRLMFNSPKFTPLLKAGVSFLLFLCMCALYLSILPIINIFCKQDPKILVDGYILDIMLLIIGLVILYFYTVNNDTIVGNFIKGKFEGICPRIEWIKSDKKENENS